jgi:hypothetical protein
LLADGTFERVKYHLFFMTLSEYGWFDGHLVVKFVSSNETFHWLNVWRSFILDPKIKLLLNDYEILEFFISSSRVVFYKKYTFYAKTNLWKKFLWIFYYILHYKILPFFIFLWYGLQKTILLKFDAKRK